jgi:hypothetical protein
MRVIRRTLIVASVLGIALLFYWNHYFNDRVLGHATSPRGHERLSLVSRTHTLDRIYESMQGPFSTHSEIRLIDSTQRQLLWLTGLHCRLVRRDGQTPVSREFFCHSNLTFTPGRVVADRASDSHFTASQDLRLFTLIPGQLEVDLPDGFGVPVWSDESLDYYSMSLNLNDKEGAPQVRFRTDIDFVRDDPAARQMKPLFRRAVYGYEPIDTLSPNTICHDSAHPAMACGPFVGKSASNSFVASLGKTNTIHWMIPPGRYESRVAVDVQLDLPFDTTVHYVSAHLHPHGKSVALVDKTTGQTLFEITSEDFPDRRGVARMEHLSLPQGVAISRNHSYELITRYHNTTSAPIDAMSILYLYMLDRKFEAAQNPPSAQAQ